MSPREDALSYECDFCRCQVFVSDAGRESDLKQMFSLWLNEHQENVSYCAGQWAGDAGGCRQPLDLP